MIAAEKEENEKQLKEIPSPEEPRVLASAAADRDPSSLFFAGAYARMARIMLALALVVGIVLGVILGWRFAAGFLAGALVGRANFYWLKSSVSAVADVVTRTGNPSTAGILVKSLLRYGLLAVIVYVILRGSGQGLYGFFAGLFVPIAAMVCEGAYEAWSTLRHDI